MATTLLHTPVQSDASPVPWWIPPAAAARVKERARARPATAGAAMPSTPALTSSASTSGLWQKELARHGAGVGDRSYSSRAWPLSKDSFDFYKRKCLHLEYQQQAASVVRQLEVHSVTARARATGKLKRAGVPAPPGCATDGTKVQEGRMTGSRAGNPFTRPSDAAASKAAAAAAAYRRKPLTAQQHRAEAERAIRLEEAATARKVAAAAEARKIMLQRFEAQLEGLRDLEAAKREADQKVSTRLQQRGRRLTRSARLQFETAAHSARIHDATVKHVRRSMAERTRGPLDPGVTRLVTSLRGGAAAEATGTSVAAGAGSDGGGGGGGGGGREGEGEGDARLDARASRVISLGPAGAGADAGAGAARTTAGADDVNAAAAGGTAANNASWHLREFLTGADIDIDVDASSREAAALAAGAGEAPAGEVGTAVDREVDTVDLGVRLPAIMARAPAGAIAVAPGGRVVAIAHRHGLTLAALRHAHARAGRPSGADVVDALHLPPAAEVGGRAAAARGGAACAFGALAWDARWQHGDDGAVAEGGAAALFRGTLAAGSPSTSALCLWRVALRESKCGEYDHARPVAQAAKRAGDGPQRSRLLSIEPLPLRQGFGHSGPVTHAVWCSGAGAGGGESDGNSLLATAGLDCKLKLWAVGGAGGPGRPLCSYRHSSPFLSVEWQPSAAAQDWCLLGHLNLVSVARGGPHRAAGCDCVALAVRWAAEGDEEEDGTAETAE
eukprot:g6021.t1